VDSLSTAELLELMMILREDMGTQFQYWLSITFAILVARYIAGERFRMSWRIFAAVLYGLTTVVFSIGYYVGGLNFRNYLGELGARGDLWTGQSSILMGIRMTLFMVGTIGTLWFLFAPDSEKEEPTTSGVDLNDR
jgi:hypothetical protein